METMINLSDLLKHEILDLYSVEEQIIEAMPAMIEKAKNPELTRALREHLKITEEQKRRLDKIKSTLSGGEANSENGEGESKGFFSRLFGGSGGEKCKGMEGIISEGEKMMGADIAEDSMDAVVIACAQKIEHYEICGYGTARAYARELNLPEVERLLTETLNEEYRADDMLTELAVGKSNLEAEQATGMEEAGGKGRSGRGANSSKGGSSKGGGSKGGSSKGGNSSKGGSSKGGSSKGGNSSKGGGSKSGGSKGGSSKGGSSKGGNSKGGGSKGGNSSKGGSSKGGSSKGGNSSKGGGSKSGGSKGGSSKGGSSKGGNSKGGSSKGGSKSGGSKGGNKGGGSKGGSRGRGR